MLCHQAFTIQFPSQPCACPPPAAQFELVYAAAYHDKHYINEMHIKFLFFHLPKTLAPAGCAPSLLPLPSIISTPAIYAFIQPTRANSQPPCNLLVKLATPPCIKRLVALCCFQLLNGDGITVQ